MDNVMTSGEFPHKERRPKDEVQKLEIPEGFEVSEDGDIVRMCFPGKGLAKVKQKRSYCEETTGDSLLARSTPVRRYLMQRLDAQSVHLHQRVFASAHRRCGIASSRLNKEESSEQSNKNGGSKPSSSKRCSLNKASMEEHIDVC
mmetsp:Transcript_29096/g.54427  ORF Transcript_29096/g.54427 Transcript_29096/m.54427 type:complete len:145 (-) Transcript_29096:265-699(-)